MLRASIQLQPVTARLVCSRLSLSDKGWVSRLIYGHTPDKFGENKAHSSMLAQGDVIYELQTHDVHSNASETYIDAYKNFVKEAAAATPGVSVVGSWKVLFGNQNQCVHLLRYASGYADVDKHIESLINNSAVKTAELDVAKLCGRRRTSLIRPFSYWGEPEARSPKHLYDLRSYVLKPGTMIEWGNWWAKGIHHRTEFNQNVGGFFAQVGQIYMVFHIWAYKNMSSRQNVRLNTWAKPGWDSTVAYTVPLIREMHSKIMIPNDFSQLQ